MKKELLEALKEAMRNKDELMKNTITMLRAAILQVEKDEQKELTEGEILEVVAKEVKKRSDSIKEYEKANRDDIVLDLNREIQILSKYLPEKLSEEEVEKIVDEVIKTTGASEIKDMGKVIKLVKEKTGVRADGFVISQLVKTKLS